jgi:hypothetical protein
MWQDDQSPTSLIITLTITSLIIVVIILLLLIGLTIQPFLSIWQWEHIPLQVSLQIIGAIYGSVGQHFTYLFFENSMP